MQAQDEGGFADYLRAHLDRHGWNAAQLARASGISASVIGRWLSRDTVPSLDNARAIAVGIKRPLLEVLVAAGLLTAEEARQKTTAPIDPTTLSDDELLREVRRRMTTAPRATVSREDIEAHPRRYTTAGSGRRRKVAGTEGEPDTRQ